MFLLWYKAWTCSSAYFLCSYGRELLRTWPGAFFSCSRTWHLHGAVGLRFTFTKCCRSGWISSLTYSASAWFRGTTVHVNQVLPQWVTLLECRTEMVGDLFGAASAASNTHTHHYPEDSLVVSSSVLHEVKHPKTVLPSGHPQDGEHFRLNMFRLTLLLWPAASN